MLLARLYSFYRLCCDRDYLWSARHVAVRKALRQCVVTHLDTVGGYLVSYVTLTSRFTEFQRLRPREQACRELASDVTNYRDELRGSRCRQLDSPKLL